jgi:F420-dependent oxidoreductase-like protein
VIAPPAPAGVRLSVNVTNFSWPDGPRALREHLSSLAQSLDAAGVHTLWVSDHLWQADPSASPEEPMLEPYTTLGYLAAATTRLRLGTMVTATTFRAPALLIKAVTTLDVLSGGRAWLGVGAGYNRDEAEGMGLFLPPVAERFARLAELLALARQMWAGDQAPFHGQHYRLERPINSPQPISAPRIPVLIGGSGERRTLRLVAEYGDACNLFDIPDGGRTLRRKFEVLAAHCATVGRRYDDIERTVTTALLPDESAEQLAERCRALNGLGADHVVLIGRGRPLQPTDLDTISAATTQLTGT